MVPHPLTTFEIQKHYQNKPRFNGVYSRNNLPKIKHRAFVINLDKFKSIETHRIASYDNEIVINFDNFGVKHNIYRIQ